MESNFFKNFAGGTVGMQKLAVGVAFWRNHRKQIIAICVHVPQARILHFGQTQLDARQFFAVGSELNMKVTNFIFKVNHVQIIVTINRETRALPWYVTQ
ncbi:MAG: hypothetical protein ACD_39C01106G0001 [uncultured bacterium]|nr:MAG: hypothetical protein ACD_39C01106G0001 [uncultured bacterium]